VSEQGLFWPQCVLRWVCRDFLAKVKPDVLADPTLQREKVECKRCGHGEAAFFQVPTTAQDERLRIIFVCTECAHKWES
jgi:DNA-directed RNA polymerase subunit M/transcription elongation factor TFIIS